LLLDASAGLAFGAKARDIWQADPGPSAGPREK
jgi:hypothetical protein